MIFGRPVSKSISGRDSDNPPYPSETDAAFAKKNEGGYGTPYERFYNNEAARVMGSVKKGKFEASSPVGMALRDVVKAVDNPKLNQVLDLKDPKNAATRDALEHTFARAALAVGRNAVAQLGFDPKNTMLDMVTGGRVNVAGLQQDGKIYVNARADDDGSRGTIVHESIHNGLEKLFKQRPDLKIALKDAAGSPKAEEYMVRYIMYKTMGNPEPQAGYDAGNKQIEDAVFWAEQSTKSSEIKKVYSQITKAAEEIIGKRGGPR